MHVPTEAFSQLTQSLLKRWLGGVTRDHLLDPHTLALLQEEARPVRRRLYLLLLPALLMLAGSAAVGLALLRLAMDGEPVNAVHDERTRLVWMTMPVFAFMLTVTVGALVEHFALPWMVGWKKDVWVRFHATDTGWLPHRRTGLLAVLMLALLPVFGLCAWNFGDRVDDRGIAYSPNPISRVLQPYPGVTAIEMYQAINTPIGVKQGEYLVVRFADGTWWGYGPDQGGRAAPSTLAQHIATRAGKPITQLQIRP